MTNNDDPVPKELQESLALHGIRAIIRGDIPYSVSCPRKNENCVPPRTHCVCKECGAVWVLVGFWKDL